jgi:hypothetical protein
VDRSADAGVDFIKAYFNLSRDAYFAIADESRRRGVPFVGHVPLAVTAREAAEAGEASLEHMWGILLACSSREDELTAKERAENARPPHQQARGNLVVAREAIESYDEAKAHALFHEFATRGTYQVPTLEFLYRMAFGGPDAEVGAEYFATTPGATANPNGSPLRSLARVYYPEAAKLVAMAHKDGVAFMAGTDIVVPGFALHQDLERFVADAGFSPIEALQTATIVPARFLHREHETGTVEAGKVADLVLLDADPTRDIRNTTKIRGVMVRGEWLDREALDSMLARLKASASAK